MPSMQGVAPCMLASAEERMMPLMQGGAPCIPALLLVEEWALCMLALSLADERMITWMQGPAPPVPLKMASILANPWAPCKLAASLVNQLGKTASPLASTYANPVAQREWQQPMPVKLYWLLIIWYILLLYNRSHYIELLDLNIIVSFFLYLLCSFNKADLETCDSKEEGWWCWQ